MKSNKNIFITIFIGLSLIAFFTSLGIYTYRLVYYYKIEHPNEIDNTLTTKVIDNSKLKEIDDEYIFYGKPDNNYVYYSNQLWRIIKIDKNRRIILISEDNVSSLVLGYKTNTFFNSNLYNWLNDKYYNSLNNPVNYLDDTIICINEGKTREENCLRQIASKIGLISYYQYLEADAYQSYLNTGKYFWTLTPSSDYNFWYVFDKGGINDKSHINEQYNGYGVRPVITLKSNVNYISGDGTRENPYNFEEKEVLGIGSYINYSGYLFRVVEKNDNNIHLALNSILTNGNTPITHIFSYSNNSYRNSYSSLFNYLNNDFYNLLDKSLIMPENWHIGSYQNYDYNSIIGETITANVGLLNISDLFTNDTSNYYTLTPNDNDIYIIDEFGVLKSSFISEQKYIRPVIAIKKDIKVISGDGTIESPYIVGE